jgi:hypothetical protein
MGWEKEEGRLSPASPEHYFFAALRALRFFFMAAMVVLPVRLCIGERQRWTQLAAPRNVSTVEE